MKKKVSISVEEEILGKIQTELKKGLFRSQSHLMEYATKKLLEEVR